MASLSFLAIVAMAGGAAFLAAVVATAVVVLAKVSKSTGSAVAKSYDAAVLQEIHNGLGRLDERVESIETLVSDQPRSKEANCERELRPE